LKDMTNYKIVNLLEVDDAVGGSVKGLEARFTRTLTESRDLGVSLFHYGPGVRPPFSHKHREQEEAYVVVSGSGRIRLGDEVRELRQWDVVRVAPEVVRGFEAGPEGLDIIAVGGPKPEGGDGERTDDPWPGADAG
jgi:mannose-6-phosphate isomerase-like protein (cupin superfamily)